jgi:hypothetical protein
VTDEEEPVDGFEVLACVYAGTTADVINMQAYSRGTSVADALLQHFKEEMD